MNFLLKFYEDDLKAKLFDGDFTSKRVKFGEFMKYLDESCIFENTPDQYERYMQVFDEDKNGNASVEDVIRVMETHGKMSKQDIEAFLKIVNGDQYLKAKAFEIKKSTSSLYNIWNHK